MYNINGEVMDVISPIEQTPQNQVSLEPQDRYQSADNEPTKQQKITVNLSCTHYPVVRKVVYKMHGYRIVNLKEDDVGAIK